MDNRAAIVTITTNNYDYREKETQEA